MKKYFLKATQDTPPKISAGSQKPGISSPTSSHWQLFVKKKKNGFGRTAASVISLFFSVEAVAFMSLQLL